MCAFVRDVLCNVQWLMISVLALVGGFDYDITYGEAFDSLLKNINHKYSIVC